MDTIIRGMNNKRIIETAKDKACEYASQAEDCLKYYEYKEATAWATLAVYYQLKNMEK